ncbi:MAG: serine hydrolase domain-containing protein [Flavobacteriaceae bacterium]
MQKIRFLTLILLAMWGAYVLLSGTAPKNTGTTLVEESKALVNPLCEKDAFSGTVLIAKGKEILYEKACGEASKRFHVKNKLDTKFNLGSMNKMFTAVAIMQLSEQELLAVSDPISKYVDESWLPKTITSQVTIHHLLSHTSGLGSYFNRKYWNSSRQLYRKVEDFKPLVQGDQLAFTPGDRFQYSNTGMLLLGVIIEKVSGKDYFAYVRENIFEKAQMPNTDAYEMDHPVENLAIGYSPSKSNPYGWENNLYKHVIKGGPAGGGFSTVRDLHSFANALLNEKLVSKASLELLWTDHSKSGYGYGFGTRADSKVMVVGHSGGFPGLNANLDIFPESGYIIAVMSNYDEAASPLARKLNKLVKKELK